MGNLETEDGRVGLLTARYLQLGVAARIRAGEAESGDAYFVWESLEETLLAVVDGVGHGPGAAAAAQAAVAVIEEAPERRLEELLMLCHVRLLRTRGAAMSLARLSRDGALVWIGVGNVKGVVLRPGRPLDATLLSMAGIVGCFLPPLRVASCRLQCNDRLVMATDGIRPEFLSTSFMDEGPQQTAGRILNEYATGRDDALVLATAYEREG